MNTQVIDAVLFGQGNCIVQILGILPVNGDGLKMAKVQSSIPVCIQHTIRHAVRLSDYLLWEFTWNTEAFYNGKDVGSRCTAAAKIFLDPAFRVAVLASVAGDLHNYLISVLDPI